MISNQKFYNGIPWAAAIADILATSIAAEDDTPLPSGTSELTWIQHTIKIVDIDSILPNPQTLCRISHNDPRLLD